jgi:hypothetical protein
MSRPKPTVLLSRVDARFNEVAALRGTAIYCLSSDGEPVSIRRRHTLLDYPGPRYPRCVSLNPGHIHNLAARMDRLFKTPGFGVLRFVTGEVGQKDD